MHIKFSFSNVKLLLVTELAVIFKIPEIHNSSPLFNELVNYDNKK